ncbi:hypothetical protein AB6A40_011365 [Gnathostoma spinigerum]|uniref:Exonuclease domain-containing protein n=1 Tax=Gnathostoma spinigerum TaxID=75299 RepID=A0ABD6F2U7_9BILA
MVDGQSTLPEVLDEFDTWLSTRNLKRRSESDDSAQSWAFVTCGDWDLNSLLVNEAKYFQIQLPRYFNSWINIKKAYSEAKGYFPPSLHVMLKDLNIKHYGHLHSGLDDVINICAILKSLARNYTYRTTSSSESLSPWLKGFGGKRRVDP